MGKVCPRGCIYVGSGGGGGGGHSGRCQQVEGRNPRQLHCLYQKRLCSSAGTSSGVY